MLLCLFAVVLGLTGSVAYNDPHIDIITPAPNAIYKENKSVGSSLIIRIRGLDLSYWSWKQGLLEIECQNYKKILFKGYLTKFFNIKFFRLFRFGTFPYFKDTQVPITKEMAGDCTVNFYTDMLDPQREWFIWNRKLTSSFFHVDGSTQSQSDTDLDKKTQATAVVKESDKIKAYRG